MERGLSSLRETPPLFPSNATILCLSKTTGVARFPPFYIIHHKQRVEKLAERTVFSGKLGEHKQQQKTMKVNIITGKNIAFYLKIKILENPMSDA